ncbi:unnamed protein product [Cuscuta campestris]|uniref:Uncharacterized protein n=1 Tax=Cuscuta campestris TaxID=132261 RepID=A0A484LEL3_9ASTE|nr:unnamed protein product [Cuscuta campestris]
MGFSSIRVREIGRSHVLTQGQHVTSNLHIQRTVIQKTVRSSERSPDWIQVHALGRGDVLETPASQWGVEKKKLRRQRD